jgi:hypothetical protein
MPDDDDVPIEVLAERLRAGPNTPEFQAFAEDVIARMYRTPSYYTALGKFVSQFSKVETILQAALWIIAGVKSPVAQAIFGGLKIEGHLQLIKRIADAKNWSIARKEKLEKIASHLGPINKLRNDILHYGTTIDPTAEDSWLLTNKGYVHIPEKIREVSITPAMLDNASNDLSKLFYLIIFLGLDEMSPQLSSETEEKMADAVPPTWLYKPPPQGAKADKSQKTPQKPSRPRLSSRARREAAMKNRKK